MTDLELLTKIFVHYKDRKETNVNAESTPIGEEEHYAVTINNKNIEDLGYQFLKTQDFVKYSVRFHFKENTTLTEESERRLDKLFDKDQGPFQLLDVNEKWIEIVGSVAKSDVDDSLMDEIDEYLEESELIKLIKSGELITEKVVTRMLKYLEEMIGDQADVELIMSETSRINDQYLDEIDESDTFINNVTMVTNYMLEHIQANKHYLSRLFEMNIEKLNEILAMLNCIGVTTIIDGDYELKEGEKSRQLRKLFLSGKNDEIKRMIRKEIENE